VKQNKRISIVKFAGMSTGGTEKYLRNIAIGLKQRNFDVTFFYCDAAPYLGSTYQHATTDLQTLQEFMREEIRTIKFKVEYKDIRSPNHNWVGSNFFQLFKEENFDLLITGRAGHKEYPFSEIKKLPIVDTIHLKAGIDNQKNIIGVFHLSNENLNWWVDRGGVRYKARKVSHPIKSEILTDEDFRKELNISTKFVVGFHQRSDPNIFSSLPLEAYINVRKDYDVTFLILGGSHLHRQFFPNQIVESVRFIDSSGSQIIIDKFLNTLDIYCHGRKDGEINSTAIAEALKHGLPVISHRSDSNNGQLDQIQGCGYFAENLKDYEIALRKLLSDENHRLHFADESRIKFEKEYEFNKQMDEIAKILIKLMNSTNTSFKRNMAYARNFISAKLILLNRYGTKEFFSLCLDRLLLWKSKYSI
jgi:glycosyltransferase involved in cell wall biosynthesis